MVNLFVAPVKFEHNKYVQSQMSALQTKIPQTTEKDTFNERTRKSLLKINLFIKRLKWFNIFTESPTSRTTTTINTKAQGTNCAQISKEINPKWFGQLFASLLPNSSFFFSKKFICSKKTSSSKEMYREAAKLLGIECSLSSSCRCYTCQSSYFDYTDSLEQMDESEDDNSDSDCDTDDSHSSDDFHQLSDEERYTNCFLIHSEELCEYCCQKNPPMPMSTDVEGNDFSFSTFLS